MPQAYYATRLAPGSARAKTPEGYLVITGVPIARTGYQSYQARELGEPGSGAVEVFRSSDEVFNAATIASFEGKSITTPHPPTFLNPSNDAAYSKGHVQKIRRGGKMADGNEALLGDLIIKDAQLIAQLENGSIAEVSAGYECSYSPLSTGSYAQKNIYGNHVAIVPAGRCGPACRVNDCEGCKSAKEVTTMDGNQLDQLEHSLTTFQKIGVLLGWKPPAQATQDADPGAVERNRIANEQAAINQRKIALDKEKEEEEKMTAKDAEEKEKEEKKAEDRAKAQDARIEKLQTALDALLAKDAEKDDEDEDDKDKEMEDELIPIHALSGNEIPKNPIPGADKAIDALKVLKPLVAKSGKAEFRDALNLVYKTLRVAQRQTDDDGGEGTQDAYARLNNASERTQDSRRTEEGTDRNAKASSNFIEMTKAHHRRTPAEVKQFKEAK